MLSSCSQGERTLTLTAFLKGWFYVYGKELRNPVIFLLIIVVRKEAGE